MFVYCVSLMMRFCYFVQRKCKTWDLRCFYFSRIFSAQDLLLVPEKTRENLFIYFYCDKLQVLNFTACLRFPDDGFLLFCSKKV